MKKRKGFIRCEWPDGSVDWRPIDPDTQAIPSDGWVGKDGGIVFDPVTKEPSAEQKVEWWESQDALNEMATTGKAREGKAAKAQRKKAVLVDYIARQWPGRPANWVVERKYPQRVDWWPEAAAGTEFEGSKPPGMNVIREAAATAAEKYREKTPPKK